MIPNYSQQDATFLDLSIFTDTLHVSGDSSPHHQEHITVHTAVNVEEMELHFHLFHGSI
jgi:hypothetical protein